jgi:hypothetical protein
MVRMPLKLVRRFGDAQHIGTGRSINAHAFTFQPVQRVFGQLKAQGGSPKGKWGIAQIAQILWSKVRRPNRAKSIIPQKNGLLQYAEGHSNHKSGKTVVTR